MPKLESAINFVDKKFGKLTIVLDLGRQNGKPRRVKAICDCGTLKEFRLASLKNGSIVSCGCFLRESTKKIATKHGLYNHPLNGIWHSIKSRCYNEKDLAYNNYGARGVRMSNEWIDDFKVFYDWCIENGWVRGLDIDKDIKNPTGHGMLYSSELCSIVSRSRNLRSKRNNNVIEYNGEKKCLSDWSDCTGIKTRTIEKRIKKGWELDRVFKI